MIHLVGPGGAGKTSAGASLAERLGVQLESIYAPYLQFELAARRLR